MGIVNHTYHVADIMFIFSLLSNYKVHKQDFSYVWINYNIQHWSYALGIIDVQHIKNVLSISIMLTTHHYMNSNLVRHIVQFIGHRGKK